MNNQLKTVVFYSDEQFHKEARHLLSRVESAKVVLEQSIPKSALSSDSLDDISETEPDLFLIDFGSDHKTAVMTVSCLHTHFPATPILAVGNYRDSSLLIEVMRLGVSEFFTHPLTVEKLRESYARFAKNVDVKADQKVPAKLFSFFSTKGGSGSTAIVTNFSVCLSKLSKKKVLVLDLDVQLGDAADYFGIKDTRFLLEPGSEANIMDPSAITRSIVSDSRTGVDILTLANGFSRESRSVALEIKHLIDYLQYEYDYILVDTSNLLDDNTVAALDASDLIFLVSKCNLPALRNSQRMLHVFDRLGYSPNRIRVVINRYSNDEGISLKNVEKALNFKVFWHIPNDFKSLIQSIQIGEPLTYKNQSSFLARSFYAMSAEILGIPLDQTPRRGPESRALVRARDASKSLHFTTLNLLKS
ncbi:MAG: AAA family ATPase [Acidobacteriota bacterium]